MTHLKLARESDVQCTEDVEFSFIRVQTKDYVKARTVPWQMTDLQ